MEGPQPVFFVISHVYQAIYIHQRKCAGVSIINSFGLSLDMPEYHLYNDGILSPEWSLRPTNK